MCSHEIDIKWEDVDPIPSFYPSPLTDPSFEELIAHKRYIARCSIFAKKSLLEQMPGWVKVVPTGHTTLPLMLRTKGRIFHFRDVMATHRKHTKGMYYNKSQQSTPLQKRCGIFAKRNWKRVNRIRIFQHERLLDEVNDEAYRVVADRLERMYVSAAKKELLNLNIGNSLLYLLKKKRLYR